jgi:IS5 family transposase
MNLELFASAKAKECQKYEFGSKAAIARSKDSCVIAGAKNFSRNEYDGDTLQDVLSQVKSVCGVAPAPAFCGRGLRGGKVIAETAVVLPGRHPQKASAYARGKARKSFRRRSAIEPVIGHRKQNFRLASNYLKGAIGGAISLLLAAAAFNCKKCKKWMNALARSPIFVFLFLYQISRNKLYKTIP